MKRSYKSMLGVTLLEIMLVLAIAAMVIVMSIRYYQSASMNQKINVTLSNVISIVAGAESYLGGNGSYSGLGSGILPYLPGGKLPTTGWGTAITLAESSTAGTAYTISFPALPGDACAPFKGLAQQNAKMVVDSTCTKVDVKS